MHHPRPPQRSLFVPRGVAAARQWPPNGYAAPLVIDPLRPLPIYKLPDELLVKVFTFVNPNTNPPPWPAIPYWLVLGAVCRQWRDIILNNAVFWRIVDVSERYHPEWLALRLERSQKASIQVRFQPNVQDLQASQSLRSLAGHLDHISDLTFFNMLVDLLPSPVITPDPMPILNSLNLVVRFRNPQQIVTYTLPTLDVPDGYLPALRSISLVGMSIKAPPTVFAGLRVLMLEGWNKFAVNNTTTSNFLTMLKACVSLEVVCLTHVYGTLVEDVEQGAGPLVTLPKIRLVRITETLPGHVAHLLSHMVLPANIELMLRVTAINLGHHQAVVSVVNDVLPRQPFRHRLAILRAFTVLKVHVDIDHPSGAVNIIEGLVQHENRYSGKFALTVPPTLLGEDFTDPTSVFRRNVYPHTLESLRNCFPCGPTLKTLFCVGDIDLVGSKVWAEELFQHYPHLESLIVDDHELGGSMCKLLEALSSVQQSETDAKGVARNNVHAKPVCPRLTKLFVRNARVSPKILAKLRESLKTRVAAGIPLCSLTLHLKEPDEPDQLDDDEDDYPAEEDLDSYRVELASLVPGGFCELRILKNDVEADRNYRYASLRSLLYL